MRQGERTDLNPNLLYNVQEVQPPTGNTRASGIRKLRKYAQERPDVAEAFEKVLAHIGTVMVPICPNTSLKSFRFCPR